MQLPLVDIEEHGEVACPLRIILLKLDDILNVLEFCFGDAIIFASELMQDETGFILTASFDQPARRFGHEPNATAENDEREDLERYRESPKEA